MSLHNGPVLKLDLGRDERLGRFAGESVSQKKMQKNEINSCLMQGICGKLLFHLFPNQKEKV